MRITKAIDERKAEFISVAEKMFLERGVSETSVSRIVKEVGVAQGLFYYYFKSKDEVIKAVIDKNIEDYKQQLEALARQETDDFSEQLHTFVRMYCQAYETLRQKLRGYDAKHTLELFNHRFRKDIYATTGDILFQIVNRGIAQGKVRLAHPKLAIQVLVSGIGDVVLDYGFSDRRTLVEILYGALGLAPPEEPF